MHELLILSPFPYFPNMDDILREIAEVYPTGDSQLDLVLLRKAVYFLLLRSALELYRKTGNRELAEDIIKENEDILLSRIDPVRPSRLGDLLGALDQERRVREEGGV